MLHVDYFRSQITTKGRSKIIEEPTQKVLEVGESLLVLASVEKADEEKPDVIGEKAATEIIKIASHLRIKTVVLHSFAHLFADLSSPKFAVSVLKNIQRKLANNGYIIQCTPFGWFNTVELKAKGHPISRIARIITA